VRHAHRPGQGSRVVALCDPDPAAAARFQHDFGTGTTVVADLAAFADLGLAAAFVISPDHLHEEQAVTLLAKGVAVYIEKHMATPTEGCDRILATARATGTPLYVGHNMRHMAFVREMKRLIDGGAIGTPKTAWARHFVGHGGNFYFADWHAQRRYGT